MRLWVFVETVIEQAPRSPSHRSQVDLRPGGACDGAPSELCPGGGPEPALGRHPPPHGTATTWGGAAARSSLCCQKVSAGGLWCENQVKILCAVCLKHTRSLAEKLRLRLVCASLWGWALPSRASPPSLCDSHGAPSARGRGFRSCQVLGSLSLWFSACW